MGKDQTVKGTRVATPGRIGGLCHDISPVFALVSCCWSSRRWAWAFGCSWKVFFSPPLRCAIVSVVSFFFLGVSLHHSSLAVYRFPVAVTVDLPLKPTTHFLRLPGQSSPAITAGFRFYRLGRNIFCSPVRSRALCCYEVPIPDEGTSRRGKKVKSRRKQLYIF